MTNPAFYSDRLSLFAGESLAVHISAAESPCTFTMSRLGKDKETVLELTGIDSKEFPVPEAVSEKGCGWPEHSKIEIPNQCKSGYYELALTDSKGNSAHHFVVVKERKPKSKTVLVIATNTYQAYNYWGGYNSYANVGGLMRGEVDSPTALSQGIGNLSLQRPFPENIVSAPSYIPRLVNLKKREFEQAPYAIDPAMAKQTEFTPFDGSAGFVNKWEHKFVEWAEERNIGFDYLIDTDLDNSGSLEGYETILVVGHSEYWSAQQLTSIDTFVEDGGNLCVFSGNTSYWKVRWEDDYQTMIAHKWRGEENDPLWAEESTRGHATGLWSHPEFNTSEAQTIGLSFLYGGYHRLGNCASRGQGGFTVYDEGHWSLDGTDLFYGDVFGDEVTLVGYESDGCPLQFNESGRLTVGSGGDFPDNLEIIAIAPVVLCESLTAGYEPVIPPEQLETIARIKKGVVTDKSMDDSRFGHAVIASFEKGKGKVFNAGTTEWVFGLEAGNTFVEKITENVFRRFNVL